MTSGKFFYRYETPIGKIGIAGHETAVTHLFLDSRFPKNLKAAEIETPLLKKTYEELCDYFDGRRTSFDIPLDPGGTVFQKRVWKALCSIPCGETRTYGSIAEKTGNPKASRAVGMANNKNPIMILIPCHRVVGADGGLVGYAGGLDVKEKLLAWEKRNRNPKKETAVPEKAADDAGIWTGGAVRSRLESLADPEYAEFSASLLPGVRSILGVRLPALRRTAAEIARTDWRSYLKDARDDSFEETMLQGLVISTAKTDFEEKTDLVRQFVPAIDNWSVCDSFCASLKMKTPEEKAKFMEIIREYAVSEKTYDIRFAAVMMLTHYIDPAYIDDVLEMLGRMRPAGHYAEMGIAWAVSVCFVKFPEKTMLFLEENRLDDKTHNRSLQKIAESNRVNPETKKRIRCMKRK